MFLVIIVKQDMYNQVTKCLQFRNMYSYDCLHNVMTIHTLLLNTILTGYNILLWPAIFLVHQNLLCACLCVSVHV